MPRAAGPASSRFRSRLAIVALLITTQAASLVSALLATHAYASSIPIPYSEPNQPIDPNAHSALTYARDSRCKAADFFDPRRLPQ